MEKYKHFIHELSTLYFVPSLNTMATKSNSTRWTLSPETKFNVSRRVEANWTLSPAVLGAYTNDSGILRRGT